MNLGITQSFIRATREWLRCGIGGCGNSRLRGVARIGVMAIPSERQQGVLLGALRFLGLWQPRSCHNSRFDNGQVGGIAITPNYATCEKNVREKRAIRTNEKARREAWNRNRNRATCSCTPRKVHNEARRADSWSSAAVVYLSRGM